MQTTETLEPRKRLHCKVFDAEKTVAEINSCFTSLDTKKGSSGPDSEPEMQGLMPKRLNSRSKAHSSEIEYAKASNRINLSAPLGHKAATGDTPTFESKRMKKL